MAVKWHKQKCYTANALHRQSLVTDDREAYPKRWVAALVQVRSEKSVSKRLQDMGFESWVPTQSEIHRWSDRKKKVERVVIPMIVFVHVPEPSIKELAC